MRLLIATTYLPSSNYFKNSALSPIKWSLCYSSCATCTILGSLSVNKCDTCNNVNFFSIENVSPPFNCYDTPPEAKYFLNDNLTPKKWSLCHDNCATCQLLGTPAENKCNSCLANFYSLETAVPPFHCYQTSPQVNYYLKMILQGSRLYVILIAELAHEMGQIIKIIAILVLQIFILSRIISLPLIATKHIQRKIIF